MSKYRLLSVVVPYILFMTTVMNFLFVGIGLSYLYFFVLVFGIYSFSLFGFKFSKNDLYFFIYIFLYLFYISIQLLLVSDEHLNLIVGGGAYIIFPFFWILFMRFNLNWSFEKFVFNILPIIIGLACLGIIQYHFSPDLFGFLKNSISNNILWANESSDLEYILFFRSTSILASPQVYGLFIMLFVFLIHRNQYINDWLQKISILICFVGAAHSGNKMVYLLFLLYIILIFCEKYKISKIKALLNLIVGLFISGIILFELTTYFEFGILTRIFSLDQIIEEESEGRLSIYLNMLSNSNWIFGEGPGTFSTSAAASKDNYKVAESYFLQFLLENGVIFFLILVSFCVFLCLREFKAKRINNLFFLLAFFCSMIFVHAHTDPVFCIFWGATINILLNKDYNLISEKLQ